MVTPPAGTILSGMRPTGRLHIGHLVGALDNWVRLQETHRCYFVIVDWHALTTDYENPKEIGRNVQELAIDWLSVGIDPGRTTLFVQSQVKEHAELHLLLSMLVPMPWLERNPTLKEMIRDLELGDKVNYGLMGYPVLQAADILLYKADAVPVGEDQVAHVELTREIARRFNYLYGEVFPEPKAILTPTPRLLGWDGRKMSKSLDNCIYLSDDPGTIEAKVRRMITDPAKIRRGDPGNPDICSVFSYHSAFTVPEKAEIEAGCRSGALGCVECKGKLARALAERLAPCRERRAGLERDLPGLRAILREGRDRAREVAATTMVGVRTAMGLE